MVKIESVTLFPDRARVTRRIITMLDAGRQKVAFPDLPLSFVAVSIRAAARSIPPARSTLLGVVLRREHFTDTPAETVRELEAQIAAAEDDDARVAAESSALETETSQLAAVGSQAEMHARGLALRGREVESVGDMLRYLRERTVEIQKRLVAIRRERVELKKTLDRLRREWNEKSSSRPRIRLIADVELQVEQGGEFEVDLIALQEGASWMPLYDLRLTDAGLSVQYLANLTQNTGEDWAGVEITLSTARPALSLVVPELDPWYIAPRRPPMVMQAKRAAAPASPQPMAAMAMKGMEERLEAGAAPQEAEYAQAEVGTSGGAAVSYRLADRADVPGNGEPRKLSIATFSLKPELDYVTAPKLADAAYRRAKVKNDSPYALLPGYAQLFDGDEFLGATEIALTAPGEEFELTLGPDDRVRVERELKLREVDKKFMADRRRIRFGYEIKVTNLRESPQTVLVRDQIPVSRHEEIKVKLEKTTPFTEGVPAVWRATSQSDLNLLEWNLSLTSGQSQTVRFEFSVESPREMEVEGLGL